jgi:hypothetical protein
VENPGQKKKKVGVILRVWRKIGHFVKFDEFLWLYHPKNVDLLGFSTINQPFSNFSLRKSADKIVVTNVVSKKLNELKRHIV